jgi:hypothetical protein
MLQIMFFLYQVLYFFKLGLPITAQNSLHIISERLWQNCQYDMMAKGAYIPRAGGSRIEREGGTT